MFLSAKSPRKAGGFLSPSACGIWRAAPIAAVLLASCGGGGGGGGGTSPGPGSPPPPPPPPPPPVSIPLPASLSASFPENGTFAGRTVAEFRVYAPSSTQPTGLALNGADAEYFDVSFDISAADAGGFRDVVVSINTSTQFDFEDPFDQNGDNTYQFTLTGQYLNQALRSDVTVNITDVLDAALIRPMIILGPAGEGLYGSSLGTIPDITGDGKAEISVSLQAEHSTFASLFLRSESFSSRQAGNIEHHSLSPRPVGLIRSNQAAGIRRRLNFLSAQPGPNGSGTDMLSSEAATGGPFLFRFRGSPPSPNIEFDFRADNAPNFDQYKANDTQGPISLLIPDISGDGIADIFIRFSGDDPAYRRFGIIFGKSTRGLPPEWVSAPFDITFEIGNEAFWQEPYNIHHPIVKPIGDLDGDGLQELVISFPQFSTIPNGNNRYWVVRGSALAAAAGGSIDLENLPPADGIMREGQLESIFPLEDHDSDGTPTFVLATRTFFFLVDGHELLGLGTPGGSGSPSATVNLLRSSIQIGSRAIPLPDLDGDGLKEIVAINAVRQDAAIIRGSALRNAMNAGGASFTVPDSDIIDIEFQNIVGYGRSDAATPLLLEDNDALVFGFASLDNAPPAPGSTGRIAILPLSKIEQDIQAGQPKIELK